MLMAELTGAVMLLSDLHLPDGDSPLRKAFVDFIDGPARSAAAVYLLGDIFEYWVGDDVGLPAYALEIKALRRLTTHGVPVFIIVGNRDFLLGDRFSAVTGAQLLPDPVVVEIAGKRTLLTHGDLLCTADSGYQRWRRFSRARFFQRLFLRLPSNWRLAIAGSLRAKSRDATVRKADDILDVEPEAVGQALRDHAVDCIIHGHTHRPADHALRIDGRTRRRFVLADWHTDQAEVTVASRGGGLERVQLPVAAT
jgi:UDP-2,3-diacylglucosamine hydrolase